MSSQGILKNLENTFGRIPIIIEQNLKYLSYNEEYNVYTCEPCQKVMKVVEYNDSTTRNFETHLLSKSHIKCTINNEDLLVRLQATFGGNIPKIVQNNLFVLGVDGNDYECAKCKKIIKVRSNIQVVENNFSYHLLSALHEEKLEEYRDVLSKFHGIYGGIPSFILNHAQFLGRNGTNYLCTCCNKTIMVHPSDVEETEKSFEKHLHSLKHMRIAKEARAFSMFPELKSIFHNLPNYMLRNIEYISVNGPNFFCSLCNENIKYNRHDLYETEQNFKFHISTEFHEYRLSNRRDPKNHVFHHIQKMFETYPSLVLENLKYISINEGNYFCNVCKDTIYDITDNTNETEQNLVSHFESSCHATNVETELSRQSEVITDLEDVIGSVPDLIYDNIKHIEYMGNNDYKCLLCNKVMKSKCNGDYDYNTFVTEENFGSHLNSSQHSYEVGRLESIDDDLETDLKALFSSIPQFIMKNLDHIAFTDKSDAYQCFLCNKIIPVVNGNKKIELTEQNFRTHLLSVDHMAKLKCKANLEMVATENLEFIFHKVPYFVLNNIQYLENQEIHFHCTLCDVQIMKGGSSNTAELTLKEHLCGARHLSNVNEEEDDIDEALQRLEHSFSQIPEFLMGNIDYLCTSGDNLFCVLCQEVLHIDEDDFEGTEKTLNDHMYCNTHQSNLKTM